MPPNPANTTVATAATRDPTYLVQLSGGVGSYAAARRLLSRGVPAERLVLMFADVLGEHPDTYRFLIEASADLAGVPLRDVAPLARAALALPPLSRESLPERKAALAELAAGASREIPNLTWLSRGLAVWEVFERERFIGNSRIDPCSRVLKRELLKEHITATYSPEECRLVLGIDRTEAHRHLGAWARWQPYEVLSPLCDEPTVSKEQMHRLGEERGIRRQELYRLGFEHANCLHPDTRFLTDRGIKTLRDCSGRSVRVLGRGGGWRNAHVRSFGLQELWEIRLRRYGDEQTILATPDHLWPVRSAAGRTDHRFVATSVLQPGHRIAGMYGRVAHNARPSAVGVAAGFTFGDGDAANYSSGQVPPARAHLCGPKDRALLPYFASCRTTRKPGRIVVHDLPRAWKRPPDLDESQSYLYGWLSGYFAADGSFTSGSAVLSSARKDHLEFVRDLCARLGIGTNPVREQRRLGHGRSESALYQVALHVSTLRPDFFVIPKHLARFDARPARTPRPADWQVVGARDTGRVEEVMCAVVPDGEVFTLDGNVLTHNCSGACVKAGQGQWRKLLQTMPDVYDYHASEERRLRDGLGKDVTVLRRQRKGVRHRFTLDRLREEETRSPRLSGDT